MYKNICWNVNVGKVLENYDMLKCLNRFYKELGVLVRGVKSDVRFFV